MQTNLYVSQLGNAINGSISDYMLLRSNQTLLSMQEATLSGLEAALAAMLDDMLTAFGSAQLLIQNDSVTIGATFVSLTLRPGENTYIYGIFVINTIVLLLFVVGGLYMRGWRPLLILDYLDPAMLMMGGSGQASHTSGGNFDDVCGDVEARLHDGFSYSLGSSVKPLPSAGEVKIWG